MLLASLNGRIIDSDSHLMIFPNIASDILGPGPGGDVWPSRGGGGWLLEEMRAMVANEGLDPDGDGVATLSDADAAATEGPPLWAAHGAHDAVDRLDALDHLGIGRQLVFSQFMEPPLCTPGPEALAAIQRYNDYILGWAKEGRGRLLPVCLLNTSDRDAALTEVRRVLDGGAAGVHLSGLQPPAGLSPASPEWDPLWAMLSEAGVPALLHYGGTGGGCDPVLSTSWYLAAWDSLRPPPADQDAADFHARPFIWMTSHLYAEIMLTFLVLGGVFERHPRLRVGVVESGASWVASWCDRMDTLAATTSRYLSRQLSLKPSEYVRRQVRVAPFFFEPVASWIERSGLEEVYLFSTDFPHEEGSVGPFESFYAALAPLGPSVTEKFFVTNAEDLLAPSR